MLSNDPYRTSAQMPEVEKPIVKEVFELPLPIKIVGKAVGKLLTAILGTSIICAGIFAALVVGWILTVGVHRLGLYLGINLYHFWTYPIPDELLEKIGPVPWLLGVASLICPIIIAMIGYHLGEDIIDNLKSWYVKKCNT